MKYIIFFNCSGNVPLYRLFNTTSTVENNADALMNLHFGGVSPICEDKILRQQRIIIWRKK